MIKSLLAITVVLALTRISTGVTVDAVLDVIKVGKDIIVTLAKAWDLVDEHQDFSDGPLPLLKKTEQKLFQKIDVIQRKMDKLSAEIHSAGTQTMSTFMKYLPDRIKLELRLNDLLNYMTRLDVFYKDYTNYAENNAEFEKLTLEDFAQAVISHGSGSVRSLLERIHVYVAPTGTGLTDTDILGNIANTLKV